MATRKKSRGLVHLRRSSSGQELSLGEQLRWALAEAKRHGIDLEASDADLLHMQRHGLHSYKGIRLDDAITGADMQRPGFLALREDATADEVISHLFVYARDRFARPQQAWYMVGVEMSLKHAGITIVFSDTISVPCEPGDTDLAEELSMYVAYYESGDFLRKHARRVLTAQRHLAESGFSTGGRAPYGFARVLVDSSGKELEDLPPGRKVRQQGCHVLWKPREEDKIRTWVMILDLKDQEWGYRRIAGQLNDLGIPSPDDGRTRKDNGVRHEVSGTWHVNTVAELCRNSAIIGIRQYGRRSEGAHRRLDADGSRVLTAEDRNADDRPRTVFNDPSLTISRPMGGGSRYDKDRWDKIQEQMADRGRNQRGIAKSKDPGKFPLRMRIFDLTENCGYPMYKNAG